MPGVDGVAVAYGGGAALQDTSRRSCTKRARCASQSQGCDLSDGFDFQTGSWKFLRGAGTGDREVLGVGLTRKFKESLCRKIKPGCFQVPNFSPN